MMICRAVLSAALLAVLASAATPKFYDDDPIRVEHDTQDVSRIQPWKIDNVADGAVNLFMNPGDPTPNVRAKNVNTIDEVPDSSWFTNRVAGRPMTPEDVAKGPNAADGPAPGRWTVTSSKSDGVTPGFTIRDSAGEVWFLKFDPPGYRAMASGSEVVATKLFWALGFHVPEAYIAYLRSDQLAIDERSRFTPPGGTARPMTLSDIAPLLERADREPDGSYRVVALKGLPKIGEFRFYGTNPDDPNDLVPHEHRRELRGYRVFAAWVNHVDASSHNTLDALIKESGRAFVRHYLQDFGSTLGSASVAPRAFWEGSEHVLERGRIPKQMLAFGFDIPRWRVIDFYEAPSIGRLPRDNTRFNPDLWKTRVPIQAFLRARADDKFWAAQKLVAMNDGLLRAAVRTGDFGDPKSEAFLLQALVERRDAIVRAYLSAVNPVADPALDAAGILTFRNAAVDAGVAKAPDGYRAAWSTFDNATGATRRIGETSATTARLQPPPGFSRSAGVFIKVELSSTGGANPSWQQPVHAYFRQRDGAWRLVGFERMPD